jgi:hypothetical protein
MQDKTHRLPTPKAALPDFAPVPRKCPRHDGWTPERQRAFVEALADTGCVAIAARMVNMSPESAYMLRRAAGAESFRKAWEAAQGLGLQVVKDEAFHRAMHGQLVPVFVAGKLIGFRRKKNDRLLMFILRHYGQDAAGKKTTINYFSTKATAGAATNPPLPQAGEGRGEGLLQAAEASTTTVKTVITGAPHQPDAPPGDDEAARLLNAFAGVALDERAKADIYRALEQAAARRRALEADPAEDPEIWYVGTEEAGDHAGELEGGFETEEPPLRAAGEHRWQSLGEGGNAAEIDRAVEEMRAHRAAESPEDRAVREAAIDAEVEAEFNRRQAGAALPPPNELDAPALSLSRAQPRGEAEGDDLRLDWRNWKTGQYVAPKANALPARPELVEGRSFTAPDPEANDESAPSEHEPAEPAPAKAESKPRRPYRKRQPKPAFTGLDEAAEARAREEVATQRRGAAEAEGKRRKKAGEQ